MQDVSKFPDLVQLLMERGATDAQIRLFAGENLLRVWEDIELAAQRIQAEGQKPVESEWEGRQWHQGMIDGSYMFRQTKEKARKEGWRKEHMFNVDEEGKHNPAVKRDDQL